jgi:hypothetical protein
MVASWPRPIRAARFWSLIDPITSGATMPPSSIDDVGPRELPGHALPRSDERRAKLLRQPIRRGAPPRSASRGPAAPPASSSSRPGHGEEAHPPREGPRHHRGRLAAATRKIRAADHGRQIESEGAGTHLTSSSRRSGGDGARLPALARLRRITGAGRGKVQKSARDGPLPFRRQIWPGPLGGPGTNAVRRPCPARPEVVAVRGDHRTPGRSPAATPQCGRRRDAGRSAHSPVIIIP